MITGLEKQFDAWLETIDMAPTNDGWSLSFTLSSAPIENWFYRRNRLRSEDLKLSLTVPQWGLWRAQLERHDDLFCVQWRPDNNFSVESQQLKYRRIIKWPEMKSLESFPILAGELERVLNVKFIPHVNVGYRFVDVGRAFKENSRMRRWLQPCASSFGKNMEQEGSEGVGDTG